MKDENGIIKEVVIIDAIYNFILKDNTSNQLMLFKTTMNKNIDNKQKGDNTNKIMKIESKIIDNAEDISITLQETRKAYKTYKRTYGACEK